MLAVARRFLGDEDAARDAVQDALLSAFRGIQRFDEQSQLSTWLHRIVVNCSLMTLRRRRRKPEMALGDATLESCSALPRRSAPPSADLTLESEERADQVRAAVAGLPEAQSAVLLLRDVQSLGLKAIAELLSIGVSTVKFRLRGARHALHFALHPKTPLVPLKHWPVKHSTRASAPILAV
jgi:RNA polymerase sigma-70 factor (ECF subfamily)